MKTLIVSKALQKQEVKLMIARDLDLFLLIDYFILVKII